MRRFALLAILPFAALTLAAAPTPTSTQGTSADGTSAQATPAQGTAAAKPQAPAKKNLICASHEVTGSRFPVKECHTADEWSDMQRHGTDQLGLITRAQNGLSSH